MTNTPRSRDALWSVLLVLSLALTAVFTPASATPTNAAPDAAAEAASAASSNEPPFDLSDPARIEIGKKRFNSNCAAYCHGFEGSGGKTVAFRGNKAFTAQGAFKVITEGRRGADVMPAWGKGFSRQEIWELVAYIQFLAIQPPSP